MARASLGVEGACHKPTNWRLYKTISQAREFSLGRSLPTCVCGGGLLLLHFFRTFLRLCLV